MKPKHDQETLVADKNYLTMLLKHFLQIEYFADIRNKILTIQPFQDRGPYPYQILYIPRLYKSIQNRLVSI